VLSALPKGTKSPDPFMGFEPTTLESCVEHANHKSRRVINSGMHRINEQNKVAARLSETESVFSSSLNTMVVKSFLTMSYNSSMGCMAPWGRKLVSAKIAYQ
jgi:hypothetical protein